MLPNISLAVLPAEGAVPFEFLLMLIGVFLLATTLTLVTFFFKQRRLRRLKDPNNDHYRKRK